MNGHFPQACCLSCIVRLSCNSRLIFTARRFTVKTYLIVTIIQVTQVRSLPLTPSGFFCKSAINAGYCPERRLPQSNSDYKDFIISLASRTLSFNSQIVSKNVSRTISDKYSFFGFFPIHTHAPHLHPQDIFRLLIILKRHWVLTYHTNLCLSYPE